MSAGCGFLLASTEMRLQGSLSSRFTPGAGPDLYLLGHEELQATARDTLGPVRLAGYRYRLHAWAEEHRNRKWPPTTPEYLLSGYHALLLSRGDLDRAAALCTDANRQNRMLHVSGSHTAACVEIRALLDTLVVHHPAELAMMARLALRRDRLTDRSHSINIETPGAVGRAR